MYDREDYGTGVVRYSIGVLDDRSAVYNERLANSKVRIENGKDSGSEMVRYSS